MAQELSRTELKAIPKGAHSGYSNYINMHIQDNVVIVSGEEGFGNYNEVVDFRTGEMLAYRFYPKEKKRIPKRLIDDRGNIYGLPPAYFFHIFSSASILMNTPADHASRLESLIASR